MRITTSVNKLLRDHYTLKTLHTVPNSACIAVDYYMTTYSTRNLMWIFPSSVSWSSSCTNDILLPLWQNSEMKSSCDYQKISYAELFCKKFKGLHCDWTGTHHFSIKENRSRNRCQQKWTTTRRSTKMNDGPWELMATTKDNIVSINMVRLLIAGMKYTQNNKD